MARPRKTADDLVPQDAPLEHLVEVEETVETPEAAPGDAAPAAEAVTEEAPVEDAAAEAPPVEEPTAEEPVAEEPAPAVEEPAPPVEEPAASVEAPEDAAPAVEEPAVEAPPAPAPKPKAPKPKAKKVPKPKAPRKRATETGVRAPIVRLPKPEHERGRRKERRGIVVSNAMDKTIVVRVDTIKPHPRYKKVVKRSAKFHAHDEANSANVGDVVRIVETRPLSKTKTWRLAEVLEQVR